MLILASSSPRRQQLLVQVSIPFAAIPVEVDETPAPSEAPADMVRRLARAKAEKAGQTHPEHVVLGADTVVALADEIFGKPADLAEARHMLATLSGRTHRVYTGVCLYRQQPRKAEVWVSITQVRFNQLSPAQIDDYLEQADPLDKAGAYAIQDHEELLIDSYDGLYSNVVGLPIEEVLEKLTGF